MGSDRWSARFERGLIHPPTVAVVTFIFHLVVAWWVFVPDRSWSPDEGVKRLQTQHMSWADGRLQLDIPYPALEIDPELLQVPKDTGFVLLEPIGDHLQFRRLPILTALARPLLSLFGSHGLLLIPGATGAALAVLTLLLVPATERRALMWLLVTLASPVTVYASLFWEHTLASALVMAGLLVLVRRPSPSVGWTAAVAALFAAAAYVRLESLAVSLAALAACWLLGYWSRWYAMAAGALLVLLMLPWAPLHQILFANPVPENAGHILRPGAYLGSVDLISPVIDLLIGPAVEGAPRTGLVGQAWTLLAVLAMALSLWPRARAWRYCIRGMLLFGTAMAASIVLFTPGYRCAHGLLLTTPWVLLALCSLADLFDSGTQRQRLLGLTALLGTVAYVVALEGLRGARPHGGIEWGARFAMTLFPVFAVVVVAAGQHWRRGIVGVAGLALLLLGFSFQARGVMSIAQDMALNQRLLEAIEETGRSCVMTDRTWLYFLLTEPDDPMVVTFSEVDETLPVLERAVERGLDGCAAVTLHDSPWHLLDEVEAREVSRIGIFAVHDALNQPSQPPLQSLSR